MLCILLMCVLLAILRSWGSLPSDRILGKEAGHEGGIEIGSNLDYRAVYKAADPAIAVIKSQTVLCGRHGMKLHDCLVVLHEQMLDNELSPVRQNLGQLREGSGQEIGFRLVMTGERVRAFDNPVNLIVDVLEKAGAIALLETFKQLPDVGFGGHECLL